MKIGVISPQAHLTRLVGSISARFPEDLVVRESILDQAAAVARNMESQGVNAIVSRMPTLAFIRRVATVPTVQIEITSFDLLKAFHKAAASSPEVAWFFYYKDEYRYDSAAMESILGLVIRKYPYRTQSELPSLLKQAKASGLRTIVGTGRCVIEAASKIGLRGVLVESSKEAVIEALERARQLVKLRRSEARRSQTLWAIAHSSAEGIVATNSSGKVTIFNPSAARLLEVKVEDVVGRELHAVPALGPIAEAVRGKYDGQGAVVRTQNSDLWVTYVPITVDDEAAGTVIRILGADRIAKLERALREELHQKGLVARYRFDDILGDSLKIRECKRAALRYSRTDSTVLITGESGTGKELFAHSIHASSPRSEGPFVAVPCAALPETLLESELFGYEEGAFTGAKKGGKRGLFELAHGGTILLDEIGEISGAVQSRLLRVMQAREVIRIGGDRVTPVDVRVIAATNRDIEDLVARGRFRADLYYRLNVLRLHIPPLRDRKKDIPELLRSMIVRHLGRLNIEAETPDIPARLLDALMRYSWPGNVRELENVAERLAIILSESGGRLPEGLSLEAVALSHILDSQDERDAPPPDGSLTLRAGTLEEIELQVLQKVYDECQGNLAAVARKLGVSRTTVWRRLRQLAQA